MLGAMQQRFNDQGNPCAIHIHPFIQQLTIAGHQASSGNKKEEEDSHGLATLV